MSSSSNTCTMSIVYKRGLALILHETWQREGSEKDASALKHALESINCHVCIFPTDDQNDDCSLCRLLNKSNKSKHEKSINDDRFLQPKEIRKVMKRLQSPACRSILQQEYDYLVIAHFSHGTNNDLVAIGSEFPPQKVPLQSLYLAPLMEMEELNGKLIWLIVQACRGDVDYLLTAEQDGAKQINRRLISRACQEGGYALRDKEGSLYIQTLAKLLESNACNMDLLSILAKVREAVVQNSPKLIHEMKTAAQHNDHADVAAKKQKISMVQVPENNANFCVKFDFINGFENGN